MTRFVHGDSEQVEGSREPPRRGCPTKPMARQSAILLALFLMFSACAMHRTAKEARIAERLALIAGLVQSAGGTDHTVVLLYTVGRDGRVELRDAAELTSLSAVWGFVCEPGRPFVLGAFQDLNDDGIRGPGEPAAYLGAEAPVVMNAGTRMQGIVLTLDSVLGTHPRFPLDARGMTGDRRLALHLRVGEVVTLDDARFGPDTASDGMWTPLAALRSTGAGIYFLEPYDPHRTPVLFVHGIAGSPRDFSTLIGRLDRARYQAWVFHYPSGFRLAQISRFLARGLGELWRSLGFRTVDVVAHSMGGLVSREAVLELGDDPGLRDAVGTFITLSSPIAGHYAAVWGLKFTPEPVPAWVDMDPESEFIHSLERPLPKSVPFHLLFSFRRGGISIIPYSSDSVVTLQSQIPLWAQREAVEMRGFDADHMEILQNEDAVKTVLRALGDAGPEVP
jgi:pimeloyl-ACP methyl ester carboxylesterase